MTKESDVQNLIRLRTTQLGWRLFRNNSGALMDAEGRLVRYGLANDSKTVNKQIKSGDLIGIRPVTITPDMVGQTIGQFVSLEVKAPGWKYRGTDREIAQQHWIDLVNSMGGFARFINDAEDIK